MTLIRSFVFVTFAIGASLLQAAPPVLTYLFPAGGARGATVEVTASGTFANWPPGIWVDRDGLTVEATETKNKLKVTIPADAECGVYLVRLHDAEGASELKPFIVGTLGELMEAEPNDSPKKPQPLENSSVVNGKLGKGGDVDHYSIQLKAGQTVVASLEANSVLKSPMDGVLQICNEDGFVLDQNDDERNLDPLLVFTAPTAGTYIVRTFAFPEQTNSSIAFSGADTYVYRLTITRDAYLDHTLPMAVQRGESTDVAMFGWNLGERTSQLLPSPPVNARRANVFDPNVTESLALPVADIPNVLANQGERTEPQPITIPATISGRIEAARFVDRFSFAAKKGQKLEFTAESRALGFPLDPVLRIRNAEKVLAEVDDVAKQRDAKINFTVPTDGTYELEIADVHGHGGFRYVYRLTAAEVVPDFHLKLAASSFVITPGTPLEIPVTIERVGGFSGEIDITVSGLPEGVTAEPIKSQPKGDTAKAVKLKLTADKGSASTPIVIIGTAAGESPVEKPALFTVAGPGIELADVWLTTIEKK